MTKSAARFYPIDWSYERELSAAPCIGVDEAGRGPLAGPVVAAAVILPNAYAVPVKLCDSKGLSKTAREQSFAWLMENAQVAISASSVREIDQLNILWASMLAMERAVLRLDQSCAHKLNVLVDGTTQPKALAGRAITVIKGDQRCPSIAAASIIAKVIRDKIMHKLDLRYCAYGYAQHKGYPTKAHRQALAEHGISVHHRRSFKLLSARQDLGS